MDAPLDSDLLRTFVAIAEAGSFTGAAEQVRRTQSAVSMQIKRLEAIAGQPLFDRGARGVSLTAGGEALLTRARRIVRLLDQATDSLRRDEIVGSVSVGIPEEYGTTVLPQVLARFAERHPGVEVTVRCEPSLALAQSIDRSEVDLAVIVAAAGDGHGEVLMHDPTVWAASTRHLAQEQDPLPLAMFERGCWWRDWALRSLDRQGRRYRVAYTSGSIAGIQAAVAGGLAVGVLGRSTLPAGTKILSGDEGFGELPGSDVLLRRRAGADAPRHASMAAALAESFRRDVGR